MPPRSRIDHLAGFPTVESQPSVRHSAAFLFIDPGETTGWATFTQDGLMLSLGQVAGLDAFTDWLEIQDPALIVFEDYLVNPNIPHGGSRVETIQVIGAIKSFAKRRSICAVPQAPHIKRIGYAWCGLKALPKSRHSISHQYDAMAHGVYYLVKERIRKVGDKPHIVCTACQTGQHRTCTSTSGCPCRHRTVASRGEALPTDAGPTDAPTQEDSPTETG